jgi:C4-dicarboxylate-specific signal transduction histidine kinase
MAVGTEMSARMINLFRATSQFLRTRDVSGSPCPVELLVERARMICEAYTRSKATVRVGELPDAAVQASESAMLQVLVNLIRNAAEASPADGFIDIEVEADAAFVTIRVTDDGSGVAPEIEHHLFQRQVESADGDGLGIGLAISAAMIRENRGSLVYRRAPGRGAQFELRVPRADSEQA